MAAEDDKQDDAVGDGENLFYISEKGLTGLTEKLTKAEEFTEEELTVLSHPGKSEDSEQLVPIDLRVVDKDFEDFEDDDIIDAEMHLDIPRMVAKLGAKGTVEALVKARKLFESNPDNESVADRPKPMTVKEWRDNMESGEEGQEEDPEEEEDLNARDEEEDGEVDEPCAKKARTSDAPE